MWNGLTATTSDAQTSGSALQATERRESQSARGSGCCGQDVPSPTSEPLQRSEKKTERTNFPHQEGFSHERVVIPPWSA